MLNNELINILAQGDQNCYEGRHGSINWAAFSRYVKHEDGNLVWFEAYYEPPFKTGVLCILICGTHNTEGWKHNRQYDQIKIILPGGKEIYVDKGFYREWAGAETAILDTIAKWKGDVVFSGHSQGGATAPLGAMVAASVKTHVMSDFCGSVACFGEAGPRFTDPAGVREYNSLGIETILVRNSYDPVTQLPPRAIIGRRERRGKYRLVLLRYKHVVKIKRIGLRGPVNMLKYFSKTFEELKMLFHNPEDYTKAVIKKFPVTSSVGENKTGNF